MSAVSFSDPIFCGKVDRLDNIVTSPLYLLKIYRLFYKFETSKSLDIFGDFMIRLVLFYELLVFQARVRVVEFLCIICFPFAFLSLFALKIILFYIGNDSEESYSI